MHESRQMPEGPVHAHAVVGRAFFGDPTGLKL
jgi:hypothetical protein